MAIHDLVSSDLFAALDASANAADGELVWPAESWELLRRFGVLSWAVPREHDGQDLGPTDLLLGYERLAAACLTTCFLLSQREAAVRRIRDSGNETLCRELLPALARGERFATVGLSQLTTSRQHVRPAMQARTTAGGFILNGTIPWVTGAARADHLVIGAVLEDGRQILAVLSSELPGVEVGPPLELMALQGSLTAEVRCDNVALDRRWLLAGPAERVMTTGRSGSGGLDTSCLALGLAGAAIDFLHVEAGARPELRPSAERLEQARQRLRGEMHDLSESGASAEAATALRARANTLVLRSTQTALTAAKGAGFVRDHPAQRWARQALFFLVWSCPRPALEATLAYLTPSEPG